MPDDTGPGPENLVHRLMQGHGAWFVLHTRSRQEKAVAADLTAAGTGCFLPLNDTVRYYGRRKAKVAEPLFPGYVFMFGEMDEAYTVDRCRRLAQVIRVPNQAQLTESLASLATVLAGGGELTPHPRLASGTWVEVTSGPFKGARGMVDRYSKPDRLVIQVDVLGQGSVLEIDGGLLIPVEDLAPAAA